MGRMVDGKWLTDAEASAVAADGSWQRSPSLLRRQIGHDPDLPATPGRYHLYAAWNCPWAHRVLLARAILGLEAALPVSFVAPRRSAEGWVFDAAAGYRDDLFGLGALHAVYARGMPDYSGRVTVPLIVDRDSGDLIANESADILRSLPVAFAAAARHPRDLYPRDLRPEIDAWNERIYPALNNGVYRAGFAETQSAYETAAEGVFDMLDAIETRLADAPWLAGDRMTEADIRLFPTLARFDVAYFTAFKLGRRRICDYPAIWRYARRFHALPGVAETVRFDIYRRGYHSRSDKRNPLGIVPIAPDIDWSLSAPG